FPAQQNLVANVAASYIAETVDTFAQPGDPAELIYRLLDRSTAALLEGANPLAVVAYAELWMLRLGGGLPDLPQEVEKLIRLPVNEFAKRQAPIAKMRTLAAKVRREILGHELKSYDILAGVIDSRR